ncbi:MAG: hypothetical protein LBC38_01490 [Oscillospiraceae bacterium]|nr:hypothetical protein [Oscillospiraceae bacterium]
MSADAGSHRKLSLFVRKQLPIYPALNAAFPTLILSCLTRRTATVNVLSII